MVQKLCLNCETAWPNLGMKHAQRKNAHLGKGRRAQK